MFELRCQILSIRYHCYFCEQQLLGNSVWFAWSNGTTEIRETISTTEGLTWIKRLEFS